MTAALYAVVVLLVVVAALLWVVEVQYQRIMLMEDKLRELRRGKR